MKTATKSPDPWPTGRILVIVPTRDRPKQLAALVHSVLHTSENADVLAYVDEDQKTLYGWLENRPPRMKVKYGPRIGPVAVANLVSKEFLDEYEAFGFVPDDALFTTPGWDSFLLDMLACGKLVVAPAHGTTDVDMPFVAAGWIRKLGWFCWPGLYHWGWPSVIAALGDATGSLRRAAPPEFWLDHPGVDSKNRDRYPADIIALYDFFASHFLAALEALRLRPAPGERLVASKETGIVSGPVQ